MSDEKIRSTPPDGDKKAPPSGARRRGVASKRIKLLVDLVIFAMLAAVMFSLKVALAGIPNIEPVSLLIIVYTAVYRARALIPIYIYVFLEGLYFGFSVYWFGYLYVWAILWLVIMLIPKRLFLARGRRAIAAGALIAAVSGLFGLSFGTLMAPPQVLMFGLDMGRIWIWILNGIYFDLLHAAGNLAFGFAALPLVGLLRRLEEMRTFK